MRLLVKARWYLACLLGVVTLVGLPVAALAAQYILTFEGPTRLNAVCNSGPGGVGGGCVELPSEDVRYTVLVDFARPGEDVFRDSSGAETVIDPDGTFFADFLETPRFENTGPPESRSTHISHIGTEAIPPATLSEEDAVDAFPIFTKSIWFLFSLTPGADFSLGSLWDSHQDELIVDDSALVKEHRIVIDADVTLTEIRPAEPGAWSFMSVSVVVLLLAARTWCS